jgi:hypothetical protein
MRNGMRKSRFGAIAWMLPESRQLALGDVRVVRQVARAAVDHPAVVAARAEGEVVALEQRDLQPAHRRVARDPDAVHAAAHDDHVHVGRTAMQRRARRAHGSG